MACRDDESALSISVHKVHRPHPWWTRQANHLPVLIAASQWNSDNDLITPPVGDAYSVYFVGNGDDRVRRELDHVQPWKSAVVYRFGRFPNRINESGQFCSICDASAMGDRDTGRQPLLSPSSARCSRPHDPCGSLALLSQIARGCLDPALEDPSSGGNHTRGDRDGSAVEMTPASTSISSFSFFSSFLSLSFLLASSTLGSGRLGRLNFTITAGLLAQYTIPSFLSPLLRRYAVAITLSPSREANVACPRENLGGSSSVCDAKSFGIPEIFADTFFSSHVGLCACVTVHRSQKSVGERRPMNVSP